MEPTKISWSVGYTYNTGNFQNLRLDCSVTDYKHEDETMTQASNRVYAFVENQLMAKLNEAKKDLG